MWWPPYWIFEPNERHISGSRCEKFCFTWVSRTCLATHFITDTKWLRNSIWKIRNIYRRTRNTIFAGPLKPKRETISHNRLLQALTFKPNGINRREKKRAGFKTRPPAFRLGRVIMSIRLSVPVRNFSRWFPPVTTPLAQVGKGRIDQPIPVTTVDNFMKNQIAYFCAKVFMDIHSVRHFI